MLITQLLLKQRNVENVNVQCQDLVLCIIMYYYRAITQIQELVVTTQLYIMWPPINFQIVFYFFNHNLQIKRTTSTWFVLLKQAVPRPDYTARTITTYLRYSDFGQMQQQVYLSIKLGVVVTTNIAKGKYIRACINFQM